MRFLYFLLFLSSSTSMSVTRNMKMKIHHSSFYQLGYFGNFIGNVTARSLMQCVLACQNDDQCRLANYNSQTLICSLIGESSFVGQIISSSSETSVIVLQLCEDPDKQEPEYLCFGSVRPPVTVQNALDNMQPVKDISLSVYVTRFSSSGLLYMQEHQADTVHIYELETYTKIGQFTMFPGNDKRNFDGDFAQNYFVSTRYSTSSTPRIYVVNSSWNKTIDGDDTFYGICLSELYFIVTHKSASTWIDVYHRSNGSLAFRINGIDSPNGCGVIGDQLYILTDNVGMISTNIRNRTDATLKSWPYLTCRQGYSQMAIDSSGRTYAPCANRGLGFCTGNSLCSIVSNGLDNTQLGTFGDYWYTSGRANKYKYRFVGIDHIRGLVHIFEY